MKNDEDFQRLQEQFSENPSSFLERTDPGRLESIRTPSFRQTYLDIPHAEAINLPQKEQFYRLRGLGDLAFQCAKNSDQSLLIYGPACNSTRNHIAKENIGLVYSSLKSIRSRLEPNADKSALLSSMLECYRRTMDSFNPWKGFKFSTYFYKSMPGEVSRALWRNEKYNILFSQLDEERVNLEKVLLSDNTGLLAEKALNLLNDGVLNPQEKSVLFKAYMEHPVKNLREIGEQIGVTRSIASRIHNNALRKLRNALEKDPTLAGIRYS